MMRQEDITKPFKCSAPGQPLSIFFCYYFFFNSVNLLSSNADKHMDDKK